MIPVWLTIKVEEEGRRSFRLCLPLPVIYLILLPVAMLVALLGAPVCALRGLNPFHVVSAAFRLLGGMSGVRIEIQQAKSYFLISIV